ncbi:MAG TPA: hypothetical protein VFX16_20435 [Pseudonocardiaceae bacterium]|nr:hypothetical protein [Pseudonocardiaceae bacterium]
MTQPPQQPFGAPDPYGRPGPYQQSQYAQPEYQQPQYPQRDPGFPAAAQYPEQPGQFGTPGYLPPEYRQADQLPMPTRHNGRVVGFVIAIVVAIGLGTGAYFVFFRGAAQASPDQVVSGFAHSYTTLAHTMSANDLAKVKTYLCPKDQTAVQSIYDREKATGGADSSFSLSASGTKTNGNLGSFNLVIQDKGAQPQTDKGSLVKQNDQWLVCDTLSGN